MKVYHVKVHEIQKNSDNRKRSRCVQLCYAVMVKIVVVVRLCGRLLVRVDGTGGPANALVLFAENLWLL